MKSENAVERPQLHPSVYLTRAASPYRFKEEVSLRRREKQLLKNEAVISYRNKQLDEQLYRYIRELTESYVNRTMHEHLEELNGDIMQRDKLIEMQTRQISYLEQLIGKMEQHARVQEQRIMQATTYLTETEYALSVCKDEKYKIEKYTTDLQAELQLYNLQYGQLNARLADLQNKDRMKTIICYNCQRYKSQVQQLYGKVAEYESIDGLTKSYIGYIENQNDMQKLYIADLGSIILQLKSEIKMLRSNYHAVGYTREKEIADLEVENLRLKERVICLEVAEKERDELLRKLSAQYYVDGESSCASEAQLRKYVRELEIKTHDYEQQLLTYKNAQGQVVTLLEQHGQLISSQLKSNSEFLKCLRIKCDYIQKKQRNSNVPDLRLFGCTQIKQPISRRSLQHMLVCTSINTRHLVR